MSQGFGLFLAPYRPIWVTWVWFGFEFQVVEWCATGRFQGEVGEIANHPVEEACAGGRTHGDVELVAVTPVTYFINTRLLLANPVEALRGRAHVNFVWALGVAHLDPRTG